MPTIERVEVRIGDGDWNVANLTVVLSNHYKWNLIWDIYHWAEEQLKRYPAGFIPCPIYARAWNGFSWSDDLEQGGYIVRANFTVRLLRLPPKPPEVQITRPVPSPFNGAINIYNASFEKLISFDGIVIKNYGTKVIRYEWYFDAASGKPGFSSPVSPACNRSFPITRNGEYFEVWLKVFDNESARRVELYRAGVSYDEFRYEFDANDGSTCVKLRIHVRDRTDPPPPPPPHNFWPFVFLCALVVVVYLGFMLAAQRQRLVRDRLSRRK
jgi:hypothetical protein